MARPTAKEILEIARATAKVRHNSKSSAKARALRKKKRNHAKKFN